MRFCVKCGTRMKRKLEKGKLVFKCPVCGYMETGEGPLRSEAKKPPNEGVVVIGRNEDKLRTMPQVRIECPRCGYMRAYWWMVQTRSIDESPTQFYRCVKCGYTWREYS